MRTTPAPILPHLRPINTPVKPLLLPHLDTLDLHRRAAGFPGR